MRQFVKWFKKYIVILILLVVLLYTLYFNIERDYFQDISISNKKEIKEFADTIPIVVICWNSLTFIKGFLNQLKKYNNPILILDNNSTYQPLLEYYKEIKEELKDKITIRLLDQNYGHTVYIKLKEELPPIYIY